MAMLMGLLLSAGPLDGIAQAGAARQRLTALISHGSPPYEAVLHAFQEYLTGQGGTMDMDICNLDGKDVAPPQLLEAAARQQGGLILSLGSMATRMAVREVRSLPIVAGLILNDEDIKGKPNAVGVVLDFPLEVQFQWIKKILPECKNIGVLYNPARNSEKIASAVKTASSMGLTLHAQAVQTPSELPSSLEYLASRVDALWGVPDETVFVPHTAKSILLMSFRNRIPLIGLSNEWVKAGALYSLEWNYRDLGTQCGELALKLLRGAKANAIPPTFPRKVEYSLNLKTAAHMKITIPESLLQGAQQVYK